VFVKLSERSFPQVIAMVKPQTINWKQNPGRSNCVWLWRKKTFFL